VVSLGRVASSIGLSPAGGQTAVPGLFWVKIRQIHDSARPTRYNLISPEKNGPRTSACHKISE